MNKITFDKPRLWTPRRLAAAFTLAVATMTALYAIDNDPIETHPTKPSGFSLNSTISNPFGATPPTTSAESDGAAIWLSAGQKITPKRKNTTNCAP